MARLGGNTGAVSNKRVADDDVDAFLGLKSGGSGHRGAAQGAAAAAQSLEDIEQMLFQAAPQDLSEAIKPKKKHKKKDRK
jgi:hypothetical protein